MEWSVKEFREEEERNDYGGEKKVQDFAGHGRKVIKESPVGLGKEVLLIREKVQKDH